METATYLSLLYFSRTASAGVREGLFSHLSENEKITIGSISHYAHETEHPFFSAKERLEAIHYSWFIPYFQTCPQSDTHYFISLFPDSIYEKLASALGITKKKIPLTRKGETFFSQTLLHLFSQNVADYIPLELLPIEPLSSLLSLSRREFLLLFDYLGLHDLAVDLRRVVDAKKLKALSEVFSPAQRKYIQKLLKQGEPISFKYLEIEHWDGNKEHLFSLIHMRGINRLSKALFGSHPAFLWHIKHMIDTGRAKMLDHFYVNPHNEHMQEILIKQVLEVIRVIRGE